MIGRLRVLVFVAAAWGGGLPRADAQNPSQAPGRVEGTVTLSRALTVQKPRLGLYTDFGAGAAVREPVTDANRFSTIALYLDSVPWPAGATAPGARPSVMRQHHERFEPPTLPVLVGTTVAFPNDDDIFHNVFSLSSAKSFDLGRYPEGRSKSVTFDRPGIVRVFCHIHADMSAAILVLPHPFFATPDSTGHYAIAGVPAGTYQLVAWHDRITPLLSTVEVRSGATTVLDLVIPIPPEPAKP